MSIKLDFGNFDVVAMNMQLIQWKWVGIKWFCSLIQSKIQAKLLTFIIWANLENIFPILQISCTMDLMDPMKYIWCECLAGFAKFYKIQCILLQLKRNKLSILKSTKCTLYIKRIKIVLFDLNSVLKFIRLNSSNDSIQLKCK